MTQTQFLPAPSREWLEGSKKRLDIAFQSRFSNPRLAVEILIQVVDELLQKLSDAPE